ncbi:hypothetical protein ACK3TF_004061 [Chlorella vulgaris]
MTRPQAQARRPAQLKQRPQAQMKKLQQQHQQQRKTLRPVGKAAGANTGKRQMMPPRTLNERFARLQQQRKAMLQTPKMLVGAVQKRQPLKKQVSVQYRGAQKPAAGSPQQKKRWQGRRGGSQ